MTDSGIGIEAQHVERIFEMFGQVDSAAAARRAARASGWRWRRAWSRLHGGTINAHSEGPGRGSEFTVCLPLTPHAEAGREPDDGQAVDAAPRAAYRVLVADDLKDSADSLAHALEARGHTVHVAYDGAEAVRKGDAIQTGGRIAGSGDAEDQRLRCMPADSLH